MRAVIATALAATVLLTPHAGHAGCPPPGACLAAAAAAPSGPTTMREAALDAEAARLARQAEDWFGRPLNPVDARSLVFSLHAGGRLTGVDGLTELTYFTARLEHHAAVERAAADGEVVLADAGAPRR